MVLRTALVLAAISLAAAAPLRAQEGPMELSRLSAPIDVDGRPDEEAWQRIAPLPMTMYNPVFRGQPTQRTEIRVAYDDEHFYVGGWFYDTDPAGIRVNSLYRDRWNGDDALAIYIDAFNDNQNAKWFGTTPSGMRFDLLVSDDGNTSNESWDTFWTSRTTMTPEGWFAEVRIPFSSLGFQAGPDGRVVMGLTVTRLISRIGERVTFPEIDPKFPFRRPSVARDVVLRDVRSRTPLYVTPYVLGGGSMAVLPPAALAPAAPFSRERDTTREAGLDVRYPVTGKLTLDFTVNTDFAQVEADDQQVALDRFPLFFPERRRFFQEGSSLFDFTSANGLRLFHSRRIGLTPDFQPVRILGGARVVGRVGQWDIGALEMQTGRHGTTAGENFGVLRLRRPVLNENSTAGMLATSYVSADGRQNLALGGDTSLRVTGDEYVGVKWAVTADSRERDGVSLPDRSLFDATWERRRQRGLSYTWQLSRAGSDYRPEVGFVPRRNFTTANVVGNWFFYTDQHRYFKRVYPGALAFSTFRNADRELESGTYAFWVQWDTKAGGGGWVEPKWFHENVLTPFVIGNAVHVPAGRYDFADLQLVFLMPSGAKLRSNADFRTGTYFDGRRTQLILTPTWNASRYLELGGDYQMTLLRFPTRGESVNIHLARLRIRTALNAQASGNAFVQYNSTTNRVDFNVRLRYNVAEGTDLWLVYNEGLDTDRAFETPARPSAPLSLARALILKYSHTLSF